MDMKLDLFEFLREYPEAPGYGWGKDPKEDDWMWARRCLKKAQNLHERPYTYRRHR
jgi:hypothetical protein